MLAAMLSGCQATLAQNTERPNWERCLEQLYDYDDIEENDMEDLLERLNELADSPIDLNRATDDDLQRLFFLTAKQREDITEYIDRYRPLRSMGELALIESLDPLRKELLEAFTFVGEYKELRRFPSLKQILQHGKNELVATAKIPLYDRKGDRNGYRGYKFSHWIRYTFKYGDYIKAGLTGAQDAGEPFFADCNRMGYDHYAFYLLARRLGVFKTIALGQYKLRLGLGLAMNTGFSLGKTASATMSIPTNAVTANSSRSEAYYLQGAATTIAITKHLDATAFVSWRKIDATLNDDGSIKTLLKTGYHRTTSEIERRHNASQLVAGGAVNWQAHGLRLGATAFYTSYNRELMPDMSQAYRRFAPQGRHFANASVYYGYTHYRLAFNGETAMNASAAIATLNTLTFQATNNLTLTAIQRYYSYKYNSPFAASFGDGSSIQNENGIYVGCSWQPRHNLNITAYSDYAYHPWPRYRVSAASHSWDNMLQTSIKLSRNFTLAARYRLRLRQEDYSTDNDTKKLLADKREHRARLSLNYDYGIWSTKTQIDAAYTQIAPPSNTGENSKGWMLSQTVAAKPGLLTIAANIAYFHTDDYNSRLYTYERGTLYSFYFPAYFGKGMHAALFLRADINRNLVVICKTAITKYFDRDHISSSYQQIDKSYKTDIDLQLKWKF